MIIIYHDRFFSTKREAVQSAIKTGAGMIYSNNEGGWKEEMLTNNAKLIIGVGLILIAEVPLSYSLVLQNERINKLESQFNARNALIVTPSVAPSATPSAAISPTASVKKLYLLSPTESPTGVK